MIARATRTTAAVLLVAVFSGCAGSAPRHEAGRPATEGSMIQGMRTVIYHVSNLEEAKAWYSKVLGIQPYFDQPFYVGYNVGGYELGLDPDHFTNPPGSNVVAYWGVANAKAAYEELQARGATRHRDPEDVGGGIVVATVTDPFGNVFGIIENPHFHLPQ